jgi:hypothetical protein
MCYAVEGEEQRPMASEDSLGRDSFRYRRETWVDKNGGLGSSLPCDGSVNIQLVRN